MLRTIQKRFALSEKGATDFTKGVVFTTIMNIALMFPAIFIFIFLDDYLQPIINPGSSVVKGLFYYLLLGLGFMTAMWIIAIFQYRSTFITVYTESANRRISLAEKLRKLPLAFFGEKNLSDLTSTIMSDTTDLEHTFSHAVPQLFASVISISLVAIGTAFYNWQLSLALFWVVPVASLVIVFSKRKQQQAFKKGYLRKRNITEKIQEGLDTIQELKAYQLEETYSDNLSEQLDEYENSLIKGELMIGVFVNMAQSILRLGLVTVILVGARMLAMGSVDLFTYLVFLLLASRVYEPISEVFNNLAALFYLDVRINRMREMEALPIQKGSVIFEPKHFDITFENVQFSYEEGKKVMNDVSFRAKQGEITALVGPSGGGKSTSAKLAACFWDVDAGKIYLGGTDISTIDPETLLQYYSVVFQDVVLFNDTIIENIRLGRRDASNIEVLKAAKMAQCEEFIRKMPAGYQTKIGENGETLSGGERQRISIARALLKDAPIVLLDEATASLDVENETKIKAAISELIRNKTVLIIAHRMRTVANAHKVVVLENGTVIESGKPDKLKKQNGKFAKMMTRQMI